MVHTSMRIDTPEKLFLKNAGQGILIFQNEKCIYKDKKISTILDHPTDVLDKIPSKKLVYELVDKLDRKLVEAIVEKIESQQIHKPKPYHIRIITQKKTIKWVEVIVKKIQYQNAPAVLILVSDINKQKTAIDKLIQSEVMYRTIFESIPSGILLSEADTTIKFVNRRFTNIVGQPKRIIEGKESWVRFMSESDRERMLKYHEWRRTKAHHAPTNYEFSLIDKHGQLRRCLATVTMVPQTKLSVASFLDITERTKIEAEIRKSKAKFKSAFYKAPIAIMLINQKGMIEQVNKTCLHLFEVKNNDVEQANIKRLISQKLFPKECLNACHRRSMYTLPEIKFVTHSGKEIWLQMICSSISYYGKTPTRMMMFQDITDTVIARRIISDLPSRLLQAHEEEKQLLSQEIHDTLSQSLAALKLSLQAGKPIVDILDQLNNLIDMSRSFSHNLRPEIIDKLGLVSGLENLVQEMSVRFGSPIKFESNIRQVKIPQEVALQLYRIAQESINNAIKHSRASSISLTLNKHNHSLSIIIRDNGKGFDIESARHIPMSQKSLGLKIISERANRIHAESSIKSIIGRGTMITINYPINQSIPIN